MNRPKEIAWKDAIATAEAIFSLGRSEAVAIGRGLGKREQQEFSERLCTAVMVRFWKSRAKESAWAIRQCVVPEIKGYPGLVERLAGALAALPEDRAGFMIGQLYTSLMPEESRRELGAYYTPPSLVKRLLNLAQESGVDWGRGRVMDPACGGAAFLAAAARRMAKAEGQGRPEKRLEDLEARLSGIERDGFAAWLSMVLLDIELLPLSVAAGRKIKNVVHVGDALQWPERGEFDLVIGNPPYGKVKLSLEMRERFKDSLFGHANLYGMFTELAARMTKPGGLIAYVTPTSILGGEYFKKLRGYLQRTAPLKRLDFVRTREGVFEGVLQETMLTVFGKLPQKAEREIQIHVVHGREGDLEVERVGEARLQGANGEAWLLPRSPQQASLVHRFHEMPRRLADYGFGVSTGQLVWNRHKDQLRAEYGRDCYPIIWAEAVGADGTFVFQAARRTHLPYLKLKAGQDWLINLEPCILVQRTTAKEQQRRLVAGLIPNSFICEHPGFVVENHLNMVYARERKTPVALRTMAALLNSGGVDAAFRCISGSVAVSAYELNALPLPSPEQMAELQKLVLEGGKQWEIEGLIASYYGIRSSVAGNRAVGDIRKVAA